MIYIIYNKLFDFYPLQKLTTLPHHITPTYLPDSPNSPGSPYIVIQIYKKKTSLIEIFRYFRKKKHFDLYSAFYDQISNLENKNIYTFSEKGSSLNP